MINLPLAHNTRTLSISETHSMLPSDKHQKDPEDLEDLEIHSEDHLAQEPYPPLISFPYNPSEI